jgi:hypothetical protein
LNSSAGPAACAEAKPVGVFAIVRSARLALMPQSIVENHRCGLGCRLAQPLMQSSLKPEDRWRGLTRVENNGCRSVVAANRGESEIRSRRLRARVDFGILDT